MAKRIVVVHDVLGTLFGFRAPIEELQSIFGEQVKDRMFAELIVMDWYHAAQRDFCFLSINGHYQPIANVFKAALPRVLLQAGLVAPDRTFHDGPRRAGGGLPPGHSSTGTEADPFGKRTTERMMAALQRLDARPGMLSAFTKTYRDPDLLPKDVQRVDLWGATNGGVALAQKLFATAFEAQDGGEKAAHPVHVGERAAQQQSASPSPGRGVSIFSCDEIQVAKPDPRVYQEIKRRVSQGSEHDSISLWFVASHTWDLFAAKQAGFKTAWVAYEEFDMCTDIYGSPDVLAADLDTLAAAILRHEAGHGR